MPTDNPYLLNLMRGAAAARDQRAAEAEGGGSSADALLASIGADLGSFEPGAEQGLEAVDSPLVYAAMSTTERIQLLPGWARDLKVLGLGKEEAPPEMFVFMRDTQVPVVSAENPSQFDTPRGFREGNDSAATMEDSSQAQTVTRALNQPYLWEDDELAEAMTRMQDAGLDVKSFDDVNSVWQGLVERAAKTFTFSKGEKKVTPWDVLDMMKREDEAANGGEDPDNFTHVSTSRSVQDISEGEAWSVLQNNLSRMLGRDPSDQEVRDFTYRMSQLAARNPSISKTVSKYKDGRLVSSNTTETDSGFTAEDMLKAGYDQAQNDPQYAEFQAATTYFDATMSALGAIGNA